MWLDINLSSFQGIGRSTAPYNPARGLFAFEYRGRETGENEMMVGTFAPLTGWIRFTAAGIEGHMFGGWWHNDDGGFTGVYEGWKGNKWSLRTLKMEWRRLTHAAWSVENDRHGWRKMVAPPEPTPEVDLSDTSGEEMVQKEKTKKKKEAEQKRLDARLAKARSRVRA